MDSDLYNFQFIILSGVKLYNENFGYKKVIKPSPREFNDSDLKG